MSGFSFSIEENNIFHSLSQINIIANLNWVSGEDFQTCTKETLQHISEKITL